MDQVRIYTRTDLSREPGRSSAFKLLFVLNGELSLYVGTKERHLKQHDFSFIRPFELYGGTQLIKAGRILLVDIEQDLWSSLCPNADRFSFSISILRANDKRDAYASICNALARLVYHSRISEEYTAARICSAACDIIAILLENFSNPERTQQISDQTAARIQSISHYIASHYSDHFSLEDISNAIGFHPQYFSAYFKKNFGVSFSDYLSSYRINKSIQMLRDTDASILNIALACGFNSHKTYSNAFEKYYQSSPREYRKFLRTSSGTIMEDIKTDDFEYLRNFWTRTDLKNVPQDRPRTKINILPDKKKTAFRNRSHNIISIGRAMSCLRYDMQQQLRKARQDLNLEFVRMRDIFSDDLSVYYEDRNKKPVFSWRALDEILDFLISADLKPFIEIGYMPRQLASRKQYAGWQYHPNVSVPKSAKQWEMLVSNFITHLISRYGKDTVESWLFDFWTSPNLKMENGYWNESMPRFFQFYRITYQAVKAVDPQIRMGSPNFSNPTGFHYYTEFLDFARKNNIPPDFVSTHLYDCGDGEDKPAQTFMEYSIFDNNYRIPNIKPVRNMIPQALRSLREIIDTSPFPGLPIVIDDWNVTFFPTDFTRDTCFMGPFIVENYFNACDQIFGMGFASLSDIHEDFFNTDQLFNGGPGLMTYRGIPKNAYCAMSMVYRFSRDIVQKGDHYVIGKTDSGFELLLFNMDYYHDDYVGNDPSVISFTNRYNVFAGAPELECHIELEVPDGTYSIVRSQISRNAGSSYDAWVKMGSPSDITPEISRYLSRTATPDMYFETLRVSDRLNLDEIIEPHSVLHIRISRI